MGTKAPGQRNYAQPDRSILPLKTAKPGITREVPPAWTYPLLRDLSAADRGKIISAARPLNYLPGQVLFSEGDSVKSIALLVSGSAKLSQMSADGTQVILRLCAVGDILGAVDGKISGIHRSTAETLTASTGLEWTVPVFSALAAQFPQMQRNIVHILFNRLLELEQRFREISTETVDLRLKREITRLLRQVGRPGANSSIEIHLNQEEIAQLVATTVFTVSRLFAEWEREGLVYTRRKILGVRKPELFMALTDNL